MSKFLFGAIEHNKINLIKLKEVSKNQTSELKSSYQMLQTQTKEEI